MSTMHEIVERGISNAPLHGIYSAFYPRQFVYSHDEWEKELESLSEEYGTMQDRYYPNRHNGGNAGPIGAIIKEKANGFVYVYTIDARGDMESRIFTHEVIAGKGNRK